MDIQKWIDENTPKTLMFGERNGTSIKEAIANVAYSIGGSEDDSLAVFIQPIAELSHFISLAKNDEFLNKFISETNRLIESDCDKIVKDQFKKSLLEKYTYSYRECIKEAINFSFNPN